MSAEDKTITAYIVAIVVVGLALFALVVWAKPPSIMDACPSGLADWDAHRRAYVCIPLVVRP